MWFKQIQIVSVKLSTLSRVLIDRGSTWFVIVYFLSKCKINPFDNSTDHRRILTVNL